MAVVCVAALPLISHAAGLGRLSVLSALGQPLNAEVEIISLQQGEEDGLSARLAPMEAFRQAGVEFNPALLNARFAIERRNGKPVLRITSSQSVNEPFLDLLVELQWNTGRLVREYTFLLDPPSFGTGAPAVATPAPAAAPLTPAPAPATPVAAAPREPIRAAPLAASKPAPEGARATSTYQVKRGDTLAKVARENTPQGASFNQMLVALFRANTDAFEAGNVNRLRAGRILNIPEREGALAVDPEEARRFLQSQASEFAQYRRKLAGAVAAAPGEAAGGRRSAAGAITAPSPKPSGAPPKDELRLSKADTAKPSAASSRAAREDDSAANSRAVREAQSRAADLEKTVADLQKLLELKNKQLAEMEAKAGVKPAPSVSPAPAKVPAAVLPPVAAPAPVAPPSAAAPVAAQKAQTQPAPAQSAPEAPKPAAAAPSVAQTGEAAKAPASEAATAPKPQAPKPQAPKPAAKATTAPPPAPSMVDEFVDNPVALGGLGLVVLLLAGYGWWAWRKKKRAAQASFQDTLVAPSLAGGAAVAATPSLLAGATPATAAPVLAPTSIGTEPEEVDPVAEADVYMAYGRDAQAEEILKEALQKNPNQVPVLAKLIEIYAHRRDPKGLEQSALKLKGLSGATGPEWNKAAALGKSIDPQNGLYSGAEGAAEVSAAPAPSQALDFDLDSAAAGLASKPGAASPDVTLDFDLGAAAPEPKEQFPPEQTVIAPPEKANDPGAGLDFDLGTPETQEEPKTEALAPAAAVPSDAGLDFDLGIGEPTIVVARDSTPALEIGSAKAQSAAGGTKEADLGLGLDFEPPTNKPEPTPEAAPAAGDGGSVDFDFNLDLDATTAGSGEATKSAESAPLDLSSISLDLDMPAEPAAAEGSDPRWQEVATKLDLARAYEEMGDKSGARELLNEVLKNGDSAQQKQAQEMLVRLG